SVQKIGFFFIKFCLAYEIRVLLVLPHAHQPKKFFSLHNEKIILILINSSIFIFEKFKPNYKKLGDS
ncbi:hypothetical protein, partial [Bacillus cereus]